MERKEVSNKTQVQFPISESASNEKKEGKLQGASGPYHPRTRTS